MKTIKNFFSEINANNIPYCHFKSNDHIYEAFIARSDFDILVARDYYSQFSMICLQNNLKKVQAQKELSYPGVVDWIGYDEVSKFQFHLHVHFVLVTGKQHVKEFNIPWVKYFLENRYLDPEFELYCPEKDLEYVLFLSRISLKLNYYEIIKLWFGRARIKESTKHEFLKIIDGIDINKFVSRNLLDLSDSELQFFISFIKKREICKKDIKKINTIVRRKLKYYSNEKKGILFFKSVYRFFSYRLKQKIKVHFPLTVLTKKVPVTSGLVVLFIGADGAGKTTISNDIYKWLKWKYDAERIYLGSGNNKILSRLGSFLKKSLNQNRKRIAKQLFTLEEKGTTHILQRLFYAYHSAYILKMIKKIYKYRNQGGIAILDRYPQMQYFGINDGCKIPKKYKVLGALERKNLGKACRYQPDIVFKLSITKETALSRKPDHDENMIERKIEIINTLLFPDSKEINISSEINYTDEIEIIKKTIWQNL